MDTTELNKSLQTEGQKLLDDLRLTDELSKYGETVIGGSFTYGTMVDRDIDINVVMPDAQINYALRSAFIDYLSTFKQLEGLAMTDRKHFQKEGRPKGIWFGPIFNYNGNRWNIDIWFVTKDEPNSHHNLNLHKRMLKITEAQRKTILEIKYTALIAGTKEKGATSAKIYKAVLDNNISSYQEFVDIPY